MYHKAMNIQEQLGADDRWKGGIPPDEQNTRQRILLAAFNEIHLRGYQAASIQSIINQAGVTKGALYHHFRSKHDVVVSLIDEVYARYVEETFVQPLEDSDDPISALVGIMHSIRDGMSDESVALGCPLDNLAQEMTPIDETIRRKVERLYQYKLDKMVAAFRRGQATGRVKKDISAESISLLVMATLQGSIGIAQSTRSVAVLTQCGFGLTHYLEQLRINHAEGVSPADNKTNN